MDISTIAGFLKLPGKVIFLLSVISAILLFPGQEFLEKLALYDFKEEFKLWIGICFLLSTGLSIINGFECALKATREYNKRKKEVALEEEKRKRKKLEELELEAKEKMEQETVQKKYTEKLKRLDESELSNLREFIIQKQNTIKMSLEDPVVMGLFTKKIIYQVGDQCYQDSLTGITSFFSIDSRAIDYLESYDYKQISHIERPMWLNGILSETALNETLVKIRNEAIGR
ncbi:TPA: superinfection exclusion B family protein [Aeromonas salmonicida]|nr:superinfection exclusion B family protein [Aeromonas salmonicida]